MSLLTFVVVLGYIIVFRLVFCGS